MRALFLEDGDAVRNVVAGNCSVHPSPPCFVEQNYKGRNGVLQQAAAAAG